MQIANKTGYGEQSLQELAKQFPNNLSLLNDKVSKERWAEKELGHATLYVNQLDANKGGGLHIYLNIGGATIVDFKLRAYPSCCAAYQLYSFNVYDNVNPAFLDALFNTLFHGDISALLGVYFANKRLIIAMVQSDNNRWYNGTDDGRTRQQKAEKLNVEGFPQEWINTKAMEYQVFYDFLHTRKRCKTMSTLFNSNSGRIIHMLEVIV